MQFNVIEGAKRCRGIAFRRAVFYFFFLVFFYTFVTLFPGVGL